jgi:hypothetical protein
MERDRLSDESDPEDLGETNIMNFIEQIFGFWPDNGSGMIELWLILVPSFAAALWLLSKFGSKRPFCRAAGVRIS